MTLYLFNPFIISKKSLTFLGYKILTLFIGFFPFLLFSDDDLDQKVLSQVKSANVLVAITVHFDASRLEYLERVLSSLSTFPQADVILVTNTSDEQELLQLQAVYNKILPNGIGKGTVSIRTCYDFGHPFNLTWCHKELISNEFLKKRDKYSHFIYLEDDISFNFLNFCYFVKFREVLREKGLLPSFLRVEYSDLTKKFVSTDQLNPINVFHQPHLAFENVILVNPPNPYMACFVLDQELASEYVLTRSFNLNSSSFVHWNVRERAAMGLCFENIPNAFQSRYLVPVSTETGKALNEAQISHLPNNYANDPSSGYGKIAMDSLFILPISPQNL